MVDAERQSTEFLECIHCGNNAPMDILTKQYISTVPDNDDEVSHNHYREQGYHYQLLLCQNCKQVILFRYFESEYVDEDLPIQVLYPSILVLSGLPTEIKRTYELALKVGTIDTNAYGVLLRRILEMVCLDRKAKGNNLYDKIKDLAGKNEIPGTLSDIAHSLRQLGNIGAHAELGDLTREEIPLLNDLCKAILEYVYVAPYMVARAQKHLDKLKKKK